METIKENQFGLFISDLAVREIDNHISIVCVCYFASKAWHLMETHITLQLITFLLYQTRKSH